MLYSSNKFVTPHNQYYWSVKKINMKANPISIFLSITEFQ